MSGWAVRPRASQLTARASVAWFLWPQLLWTRELQNARAVQVTFAAC